MEPEIQAFASENGRVTTAWAVEFFDAESRPETARCSYPQKDGSYLDGTIRYTLEISKVRFRTPPEALQAGSRGQLSSPGDCFHEVAVTAVEATGEYDVVLGEARKKKAPQF
jgi:hypothetical protein